MPIPKSYKNTVESTIQAKNGNPNFVSHFFNGTDEEEKSSIRFNNIDVNDITPRSVNKYKQSRIARLARSIRNTGNRLIHPIVLVRGTDLPEDREAYKRFMEKGVDPKKLKYVIVSGERRYRAWLMLREEDAERIKRDGGNNRFDYITANVLTEEEAKKEQYFFEDSNLETRQLTSLEAILHIKDAIEEVETLEQKKEALAEMGKDPEKVKFNQADYCLYYLQNELGIENVTIGTIKNDLSILNNCPEPVIDAIIDGTIAPSIGRDIYALDKATQLELLRIYKEEGPEAYRERLAELKMEKETPRNTRLNHKDAAKAVKDIRAGLNKKAATLKYMMGDLGDKDKQQLQAALKAIEKLSETLSDCYEKLK